MRAYWRTNMNEEARPPPIWEFRKWLFCAHIRLSYSEILAELIMITQIWVYFLALSALKTFLFYAIYDYQLFAVETEKKFTEINYLHVYEVFHMPNSHMQWLQKAMWIWNNVSPSHKRIFFTSYMTNGNWSPNRLGKTNMNSGHLRRSTMPWGDIVRERQAALLLIVPESRHRASLAFSYIPWRINLDASLWLSDPNRLF